MDEQLRSDTEARRDHNHHLILSHWYANSMRSVEARYGATLIERHITVESTTQASPRPDERLQHVLLRDHLGRPG